MAYFPSKEKKWIKKMLNKGYTQNQLMKNVGLFSNKKKQDVMKIKRISSKEYDKRYKFLSNVYALLEFEEF